MRRQLVEEGRDLVDQEFIQEVNTIDNRLHELNLMSLELNGVLNTLEAQMKVEAAKITLARLNPQRVSKEALDTAKQNLLDAQRAAGVIESEAGKVVVKQTEEAARARRTAEAIAAAKSVQERIDRSKENQKRLEDMYGEEARGQEYSAISEAKRASRVLGKPVLSVAEQVDIKKNPLKVLGGYRGKITEIENRLDQAQKTSEKARMQEVQGLLEARDKLDKQYKDAKSADERSEILPELEEAENAYDKAVTELTSKPVTWKGMAQDIKELSAFYQKEQILEEKINNDIPLPTPR
jgi:hypothetical protein